MPAKLTYAEVSKAFETKGYKLVSTEYISNTSPLTYLCNNGHENMIEYICIYRMFVYCINSTWSLWMNTLVG
jgi:hypothetical protein